MILFVAMIAAVLLLLLWIGLNITGAIIKAFVWLFILLPIALVMWIVGIAFCCTIILIPIGKCLIKAGADFLYIL